MANDLSREVVVDCGGSHSGRFNAAIRFCGNGVENHILTLTLRLYMRQVSTTDNMSSIPEGYDVSRYKWSSAEWSEYLRKFQDCAAIWNKRFCLVPPDGASDFKYSPWFQKKYMPNVECHLRVEFCGAGNQHWEVKVLKATEGVGEQSNTGIGVTELDSTDTDSIARTSLDGTKLFQTAAAHEIGHMLGQPHAGALLKSKDCLRAIEIGLKGAPPGEPVPKYMLNSHNASACYGLIDGKMVPGVSENIMGLGMAITEVNAISWRNALSTLVYGQPTLPPEWTTVVRAYMGPRMLD